MQLNLTGRHFEITPTLRKHVEEKFGHLERFNSRIIEGDIVLFKDHVYDVAEGKIHLGHAVLTAKSEATGMVAAVDDLVDKLLIQLQRYEGKLRDRKRHPRGQ